MCNLPAITGWYNPGSGIIDGLRQQLSDGSTITTGLPQGTQQSEGRAYCSCRCVCCLLP